MLSDLRYALRTLGRSPGFALTAIVSIGLAIGANAAIFSLADALVLRPLPVPDPSGVVTLASRRIGGGGRAFAVAGEIGRLSYPDYLDFRNANRSFQSVTAYTLLPAGIAKTATTQPTFQMGFGVTADFFDTIGVAPILGRGFRADENQVPRRDAVIVLAHGFWARELFSDPAVIGRRLRLNGIDVEVIGVAPESFTGMDPLIRPAFYVPLMMQPALSRSTTDSQVTDRRLRFLRVKGRLKPGVTVPAASAEAAAIFASLERTNPDSNRSVVGSCAPNCKAGLRRIH